MDLLETFDHYLNYPRDQAYNLYLDRKNLKIFRPVLLIFIFIYVITTAVNIGDLQSFNASLVISVINLIVLTGLRFKYKKIFNINNIRRYIYIFLIVQLLMLLTIDILYPGNKKDSNSAGDKKKTEKILTDEKDGSINITVGDKNSGSYAQFIIMFCILIMIFRFSRIEIIQLFAIGFFIPLISIIVLNQKLDLTSGIPNLIVSIILLVIALTSERKRQQKFYEQYDFSYKKNYENLRMKKELNYAREIQLSMLPENEAIIGDLEIAAVSLPASEVGGDYFDYFKVSENEIGIFICDVSGHGVASGLLLSGLRSCMHLILEDHSKPGIVIEKLNRMIRKTQNRKMFVTAIFAIIDVQKNKCYLYNAGHLPPYKISGESKEIFKIRKHGIALGAMRTVEAEGNNNEVVFDFKKNDKIIFYTDGVNEAMDDKLTEYGLDNLELYLNNNADKKANELLKGLVSDVKKFSKNTVQRDDLTLLIIQRN